MKKDGWDCIYLHIFVSDMKRFRHIVAVLLSLAVVYAGAGVSIAHYCCNRCAAEQAHCLKGCARCDKSDSKPEKSGTSKGCTATYYKVNLAHYSCESSVVTVPVVQLLCETLLSFQCALPEAEQKEVAYTVPPHPDSSRHYLALYSVLVI